MHRERLRLRVDVRAGPAGRRDAGRQPGAYPRNETLYTSGTQWGPPSSWNPIWDWDYATGTWGSSTRRCSCTTPRRTSSRRGWPRAASGPRQTYTLKLREGLTWRDGEPLTADDVVFTLELGKIKTVPYSNLWTWLERSRRSTT